MALRVIHWNGNQTGQAVGVMGAVRQVIAGSDDEEVRAAGDEGQRVRH